MLGLIGAADALPAFAALDSATFTPQAARLAQLNPGEFDRLRSHLQAQDWQAADAETRRLLQRWLHPSNDIFSLPLAANIPADVLRTLDQLWSEASNGRFGFSAQQAVWQEIRAEYPDSPETAVNAFGDRVGWRRPARDSNNFVSPEWFTEPELNYSLTAPAGHLPWAGVDWARIESMLTAQSCGSCMIDAMYLQGERFTRYLPALFNQVAVALAAGPAPSGRAWSQAQLAHSINLRSLYPDSACPIHSPASALSPNGAVLAISSYSYERACSPPDNSTLALWNPQRGTRIITLLRGQAMEASDDSGQAQEPATEASRMVGEVANAIAFTPNSRLVAAGLSDGTVRIWIADTGQAVRSLQGHAYAVRAIAIAPDGRTLASASADQTVRLWDLRTGQLRQTMRSEAGIVHTLLISPDGQRLATASDGNVLQLWDAQTGQLIRTLVSSNNQQQRMPIVFSPDSQTVAAADSDRSVKLWNARTGARIITFRGHLAAPRHLAFSPNSQRLASSDGLTARLWNLQTYQAERTLDLIQTAGHPAMPDNLGSIAFSPDGQVLAASTLLLPLVESEPIPRQGVTLWDAATGQTLTQIHHVGQFQFSPSGQSLIAQGQQVQIWQAMPSN
ncbi:MAG: hypothetical protein F6J97_15475 [Leptolyngbya sp. SIO4C1]|nr:hypothetical protein [Leptolyngbya sp. SIO4C1]